MSDFLPPPSWSLALGTIGRLLIYLSAGLFAVSAVTWLRSLKSEKLAKFGRLGFGVACVSLIGAFVVLAFLFATKRFEYAYVFGHSDSASGLAYRVAGVWSGQEGSFLLWGTCSALFALFTVGKTGKYRRWYTIAYAFFLGGIASILAFESPFNLNLFEGKPVMPEDGVGLSPALQNYWVIIHPPVIFLGFGSLTSLFALAFAALATKDYEKWIPIVRPWAIIATTLVGLGLCMGGFWAYETLGWGGFWMWDPVENASFVPWVFGGALIHGVLVQATKKKWQMTNLLLASLPFLAFMYGTFLTRSGVLSDTSVHSFAEMDRYALKLLFVLMFGTLFGFGGLWAYRAVQWRKAAPAEAEAPNGPKREGFYMLGIASLLTLGVATMIGMSVPMIMALQGKKPSIVEEHVYHQVIPWIFIPLMLIMAVAPFVAWNGMRTRDLLAKVYTVLCITVGVTGLVLCGIVLSPYAQKIELHPTVTMLGQYKIPGMGWVIGLFGLCLFVLVANAVRIGDLFRRSKLGTAAFLTHIGIAVLVAGLIVSRGFESKARSIVMEDHPGRLLNYEVRYSGMTKNERDRDNEIKLDFYAPDETTKPLFTATPGLYYIKHDDDGHEDTMVWPHVQRGLLMDTYVSLGTPQKNAGEDVTIQLGKSAQAGGMVITYDEMVREGEMGLVGGVIGARVTVSDDKTKTQLTPKMSFDDTGNMVSSPASLGSNMELALVSLNAEDKSVTLRVQLTTPIYPIEVYHKPMTILVWLGTGIMALGGLLSAYYRRATVKVEATDVETGFIATTKSKLNPRTIGETR